MNSHYSVDKVKNIILILTKIDELILSNLSRIIKDWRSQKLIKIKINTNIKINNINKIDKK